MIRIAQAAQADHGALVRIARTSPYTKDFSNAVMFSSPAAYAKGWIRMAIAETETLDVPSSIVGFYCVRHKSRSPETMLYFITVLPEVRTQFVGKLLMDDMKRQSPSRHIALNVMKDNRAVAFYLREGFLITGEALGGHAHRMEWRE